MQQRCEERVEKRSYPVQRVSSYTRNSTATGRGYAGVLDRKPGKIPAWVSDVSCTRASCRCRCLVTSLIYEQPVDAVREALTTAF
jgi:hypothetical protein